MVRWLRWHCPPDTGFVIRTLAVWGRARYLSITEAPHNTDFHTWMGKKHFLFLSNRRNREPNPGVKGSGGNHYPRAPARFTRKSLRFSTCRWLRAISTSRSEKRPNFVVDKWGESMRSCSWNVKGDLSPLYMVWIIMSLYGVIGYHVTLSEGHMIANHPIYGCDWLSWEGHMIANHPI